MQKNSLYVFALLGVVIVAAVLLYVFVIDSSDSTDEEAPATSETASETSAPTATEEQSSDDQEGVQVTVEVEGEGTVVQDGDSVSMYYIVQANDGTVLDEAQQEPFTLPLSDATNWSWLREAIVGQKEGTVLSLIVPYDMYSQGQVLENVPEEAKDMPVTAEIEILGIVTPAS